MEMIASSLEPLFLAWVESTLVAMENIVESASSSDLCKCILTKNKFRLGELGRRMISEFDNLESDGESLILGHAATSSNLSVELMGGRDRLPSKISSVGTLLTRRKSLPSCDEASAWFQLRHEEEKMVQRPSRKHIKKSDTWCKLATIIRAVHYFMWIARLYAIVGTSFVVTFLVGSPLAGSIAELFCEAILIVGVVSSHLFQCQGSSDGRESSKSQFQRLHILSVSRCIDAISAIPWHLLWIVSGYDTLLKLSLIRLIQFFRIAHIIATSGGKGIYVYNISVHPDLLRVVGLVAVYFLLVHLWACFYGLLASSGDETSWGSMGRAHVDPIQAYLESLYWSVEALSFGNIDPKPSSAIELFYSSATVFVGVFLTSGIVGIIASLMGRIDELSSRRRAKWDSIERFLRKNRISSDLCMAIRRYFIYYNSPTRPTIDPGLLTELSTSLRLKLDLCLYSKFIEQCNLFEHCPASCVVELIDVISRNRVIVMPMERIFKRGDPGLSMYFVVHGEIVLYLQTDDSLGTQEDLKMITQMEVGEEDDFAKVIGRLSIGESFGEMAILHDRPRAASALGGVWSELLGLPRDDFYVALDAYPDFAQKIVEKTKQALGCVSPTSQTIHRNRDLVL